MCHHEACTRPQYKKDCVEEAKRRLTVGQQEVMPLSDRSESGTLALINM